MRGYFIRLEHATQPQSQHELPISQLKLSQNRSNQVSTFSLQNAGAPCWVVSLRERAPSHAAPARCVPFALYL